MRQQSLSEVEGGLAGEAQNKQSRSWNRFNEIPARSRFNPGPLQTVVRRPVNGPAKTSGVGGSNGQSSSMDFNFKRCCWLKWVHGCARLSLWWWHHFLKQTNCHFGSDKHVRPATPNLPPPLNSKPLAAPGPGSNHSSKTKATYKFHLQQLQHQSKQCNSASRGEFQVRSQNHLWTDRGKSWCGPLDTVDHLAAMTLKVKVTN